MTPRRALGWLALVVLVAAAGFLVTRPLGSDDPELGSGFYPVGATTEGIGLGNRAPELEAAVGGATVGVEGLDGSAPRLAQLRGQPVWLVFGTTWCAPCREEAPILQAALDAFGPGVTLLSIQIQETDDTVRAYADELDLRYPLLLDRSGAVAQRYGVYGYPTHYLLDPDGTVVARHFGPLDRAQVDAYLAQLTGGD